MIGTLTLEITGIHIPPDIFAKRSAEFRMALVYTLISAGFAIISEITYAFGYPDHVHISFGLLINVAAVAVLLLGWLLSGRCGIRFPGFAILVAVGASFLKLEELMLAFSDFLDSGPTYSLLRVLIYRRCVLLSQLACYLVLMGESNFIHVAVSCIVISAYFGLRLTMRIGLHDCV